jgi:broad specificity phosphatase PhoE
MVRRRSKIISMTPLVRYLTHPQVQIDAAAPVPSWGLSALGRARVQALVEAAWLMGTTRIVSSSERKAVETAEPIAAALGLDVEISDALHENDRSATGVLPPDEFETVADAFFAYSDRSVRGWERAVDAQARIVGEAEKVLSRHHRGDVLFVGHGAVGTLLLCHYSNCAIGRAHDQPGGGGHYFTIAMQGRQVLHPWRRMEEKPQI